MMLWALAALFVAVHGSEAHKYKCRMTNPLTTDKTCNETSDYCMVIDCNHCHNETLTQRHTGKEECIERTMFHEDFYGRDIFALEIWFVGSGICISAGVGGSSLFTPLGLLLLSYDLKSATAISQVANVGSSLAAVILNSLARHPLCDRPLINYELVLYMGPLLLAGAMVGIVGQNMLPTWAVMVIMVLVLGYTSFNTYIAALNRRKKDSMATDTLKSKGAKKKNRTRSISVVRSSALVRSSSTIDRVLHHSGSLIRSSDSLQRSVKHSKKKWMAKDSTTPPKSYVYLLVIWAGRLVFTFLKGSTKMDSLIGVEVCQEAYWLLSVVSLVWLCGWGILMGLRLVSKSTRRRLAGVKAVEGDVVWTSNKLTKTSPGLFIAGILAALIGSGGGTVLGPLMLHLKVHPQVSSASSATMIMFTSSSVALLYVMTGVITPSVAVSFFIAAFVGSLLGKSIIDKWVKEKNLTWALIALLSGVIALGTIMTIISGIVLYADRGWNFETELESPCGG